MITQLAPAKINLCLHVGAPDTGGMHPLSSLVAFADIGDKVTVKNAAAFDLTVTGPFADVVPAGSDNLVMKVAKLLQSHTNHTGGALIELEKYLPVAAGMGGGSADAAAVLRALNCLWGTGISISELASLSAPLGADLPMCVYNQTAVAAGYGERLQPVPMPVLSAVLINPMVGCETAGVYRTFDDLSRFASDLSMPLPAQQSSDAWLTWLRQQRNDLTDAAIAICPEVSDVTTALNDLGRASVVRLSGSGATVFGVYDSQNTAKKDVESLMAEYPNWWVRQTVLGQMTCTNATTV